jgi:LPS O-antigen subunit length determinant protein (WzzB/FepE family)
MQIPTSTRDFYARLQPFKDHAIVFFGVVFFSILVTFFITITTPNIYKSTAILAPSKSKYSSNFSGVQSSLGGLAALAGLETGAEVNANSIAIKTLQSYDFFERLYSNEDFLKYLFALEDIDLETMQSTYNNKVYKDNKWLVKPSVSQAYKIFYRKYFDIFKDRKSGFIYLHIENENPKIAFLINTIVLNEIDNYMRKSATEESRRALSYIEDKIAVTASNDVRNVLGKLAERELQILILSEAGTGFAFQTVQSPFIPYEKDRPRKSLMMLNGTLIGIIIGIMLSLFVDRFNLKAPYFSSFKK